jgi:YHS domain-containing protein
MCQNHHHGERSDNPHHHGHAAQAADAAEAGPEDLAECPVMPGSLTAKADAEAAGLVRDYHGARYWLCCPACGPLFDADPARYAGAS